MQAGGAACVGAKVGGSLFPGECKTQELEWRFQAQEETPKRSVTEANQDLSKEGAGARRWPGSPSDRACVGHALIGGSHP